MPSIMEQRSGVRTTVVRGAQELTPFDPIKDTVGYKETVVIRADGTRTARPGTSYRRTSSQARRRAVEPRSLPRRVYAAPTA